MTIFYNQVRVNGYDQEGGLWFSKPVTGNEATMTEALREAYAIREVVKVDIQTNQWNTTFYDADGNEIQT